MKKQRVGDFTKVKCRICQEEYLKVTCTDPLMMECQNCGYGEMH